MMRFLSRSVDADPDQCSFQSPVSYESVLRSESKIIPGVTFAINRISYGRRMELSRQIRELSQRAEFLNAGDQLQDKIEGSLLAQEIDVMYLRWGLVGIDGLTIDGESATASQLIEKGPEALVREIVSAIREQCGLSEAERKN